MLGLWENKVFQLILSLSTIICMQYCIGISEKADLIAYTNSIWGVVLFLGYFYALVKIVKKTEWKMRIYPHLKMGFLYAFIENIGKNGRRFIQGFLFFILYSI